MTNSGQKSALTEKRLLYNEKDCFEKSQNYCSIVKAELNVHLETPVSTKTVQLELHKSDIHGRVPITNKSRRTSS